VNARRVGDLTTNPNPSFVGRQIRDVFFYRNRLCLTVDENVTMSRVGDFGNFYRLTVTALLPDETIDIATSETQVTPLNFAVPMGGELMVFSDEVQFRINHAGVVEDFSYISTAGGAFLEWMEGKELPGVVALEK